MTVLALLAGGSGRHCCRALQRAASRCLAAQHGWGADGARSPPVSSCCGGAGASAGPCSTSNAGGRWPLAPLPAAWGRRGFLSQFAAPDSKSYKERRLIGYSPEQLYAVVSGVQHYAQFVPWCVGSNVLTRAPDGSYLEAELQIGFQMISERYTSRVRLQEPHLVSSTVADSALFHHLESTWQLRPGPSPGSTWLSFSVDFAFLNPLYANVAQLFFSEVVKRMMGAFEGRCRQLYGPPSFFTPAGQRRHAEGAAAAAAAGGQQQQLHGQQQQQHHHRVQQHHHHHQRHPPLQQAAALGAGAAASGAVQQPGRQLPQHQLQQQQQQQQQQREEER